MFCSPRSFVVATGLVLAVCAASVAPALAQQPQGRPRVAVLNFANNSTWAWWGDRLGDLGQAVLLALREQSIDHGPMLVLTVVGILLVAFMLRT